MSSPALEDSLVFGTFQYVAWDWSGTTVNSASFAVISRASYWFWYGTPRSGLRVHGTSHPMGTRLESATPYWESARLSGKKDPRLVDSSDGVAHNSFLAQSSPLRRRFAALRLKARAPL